MSDLEEIDSILTLQSELSALENRARELSACLKAMTLVGSSLDLEEVLTRAIDSAAEVMNAEAASIMLLDDKTGELYFTQATGSVAETMREIRIPPGQGIAGWVAQTGESYVVEDARNDPRFFKAADDQSGFVTRSILAVPLRTKDRIIGVAEVLNKRDDRFSESDLPLFTAYASLAAVAIDNARMHHTLMEQEILAREIDIARQIQGGLQGPQNAQCGHFRFHALTDAARSVGGDFYDWMELGDGRAMAVIGDVSGKGIPAALLMSNALSRLRAEAMRLIEPDIILTELNNALSAQSQRGLFVTIFCALFEADGTMRYASAGHHMPLFYTDGAFQELPKVSGPPVAIVSGARYSQESIRLKEGDVLVLFTDGVTEAISASGEFFGYDGLKQVVAGEHTHPENLPGRIRTSVAEFEKGAEQTDDLTVAVIGYTERPAALALNYENLSPEDLSHIRNALEQYLKNLQTPEKVRTKIILSVDEAATNVIRHAYGGKGGPASLKCWEENGVLHFELRDQGCGAVPQIPTEAPKEIRPGGLGLVILREVMDEVTWEPAETGGCILRMKKKLESEVVHA
jgi:phosphoserine phosphatase RsbU/P